MNLLLIKQLNMVLHQLHQRMRNSLKMNFDILDKNHPFLSAKLIKHTLRVLLIDIVAFIFLIVLWKSVTIFSEINPALFPAPDDALKAFVEIINDGSLLHLTDSLNRFVIGYGVSVIIGIICGLILGCWWKYLKFFNPIIQVLRPISPMAWMPFIVLCFGIGDVPAIVIIFIAAFFPVLLSTVSSVRRIDNLYFRVAQNFGIRQPYLMWKIIFPAAFPGITEGLHLALGSAWVFLVCGEMAGAQTGLGYLIIDARNNLRADILVADIAIIGVIGLFLDTLLRMGEKLVLKKWGKR